MLDKEFDFLQKKTEEKNNSSKFSLPKINLPKIGLKKFCLIGIIGISSCLVGNSIYHSIDNVVENYKVENSLQVEMLQSLIKNKDEINNFLDYRITFYDNNVELFMKYSSIVFSNSVSINDKIREIWVENKVLSLKDKEQFELITSKAENQLKNNGKISLNSTELNFIKKVKEDYENNFYSRSSLLEKTMENYLNQKINPLYEKNKDISFLKYKIKENINFSLLPKKQLKLK